MENLINSFKFLTSADQDSLHQKMQVVDFEAETILLKEGEQKQALFVLLEGNVRVEKEFLGQSVPFTELLAGEIFGEMSLIEKQGASGTVVCNTACKVAILTADELQHLEDTVPNFAGRFYQSLAYLLSVRLREANVNVVQGFFSVG
ncbi:MAG: cyclic nucleotide-binding domain-containing protein [Gammaproteobacteria bacterium]|nr:cyclic nucleotide-binding domain-containing protein [Gammaproteobacteria bacterium]